MNKNFIIALALTIGAEALGKEKNADQQLLDGKGARPVDIRLAAVPGFALRIGARAALVPTPAVQVHGLLMKLSHADIEKLYSEPSVRAYRPEPVLAVLRNGATVAARSKYPWMPATVRETVASYGASSSNCISPPLSTFLERCRSSGCGLSPLNAVPAGFRVSWILAGVTGMGVAAFEWPKIESDMTNAYAVMAFWLPLGIVGISIVGLVLTIVLRSSEDTLS